VTGVFLFLPVRWKPKSFSVYIQKILRFVISLGLTFFLYPIHSFGQGIWDEISALFLPVRCHSVGFAIGTYGYIAGGMESLAPPWNVLKDFQQYDPGSNTWTLMPELPQFLTEAVAFSIGSKAYVVTGASWQLVLWERWTWEYDPVSDTWRKLDLFPGTVRIYASGFVVSGKAYLSPGWFFTPSDDTWEYTPPPGGWDQKGVSYRFFPNPAHEKLTILTVGSPELTSIELLDFSGRKLCSISPRPFDFYHRFVLKMISAGCINRNYTIPEGG